MVLIKFLNSIFNLFCNLFFKNRLLLGLNNKFIYPFFAITKNKNIHIGNNCKLNCFLVTDGDGKIEIGNNCSIGNKTSMRSCNRIKIGDYALISSDVIILDNNSHSIDFIERRKDILESRNGYITSNSSPILIGDDVWIGRRSIILKGVTIGDRSIIAAGSVVTENIPNDVVAAGNPAKIVKYLNK